ncbi:MAG: ROK family protein [Betaproteobacteria bacterium]|nr:ROK family protein [Betaproteobacteria bacterium]
MGPSESLGIDVGGTNLRCGVFDGAGTLLWQSRPPSGFAAMCASHPPGEAFALVLETLASAVASALAREPGVRSVGIGFPGFIDPASRILSLSPNLPGIRNADLAGPLAARFGLPVVLENDALSAAYGEYCLHPTASKALLYLGLGTGVGGGLVLDGRPYAGEHGVAMEVGHLIVVPGGLPCGCGNRGCLEQYASATGVMRHYETATGLRLEAEALATRAAEGDSAALAAFRQAAERLARGLAHVLKIMDVGDVVVGGGLSRSWPLLEPHFAQVLEEALIPALRGRVRVRPSTAQDQAGMLGAARLAQAA